jgi:hypothetical protein
MTTHLHLVPRSRMRGAIPTLPIYVFMAWCLVKHRDNVHPCTVYTRAVLKVRGLTLLLRVGTLWRCGDGLFFEVPPLASDAFLTTLQPLLENVLQTVCHKLQDDSGTGAVLGLPLRGSSFAFVSPSLKRFHHLKTADRLIAWSP